MRRTNLEKQEALCSALWAFAKDAAAEWGKHPHAIKSESGFTINGEAVRTSLREIMDIFGYDVIAIQ